MRAMSARALEGGVQDGYAVIRQYEPVPEIRPNRALYMNI